MFWKLVILLSSGKEDRKTYLLGPLIELVSNLDISNIKMLGIRPVDNNNHLHEMIVPQTIVVVDRSYSWHFNVVAVQV
jgi:hypothetical protein